MSTISLKRGILLSTAGGILLSLAACGNTQVVVQPVVSTSAAASPSRAAGVVPAAANSSLGAIGAAGNGAGQ